MPDDEKAKEGTKTEGGVDEAKLGAAIAAGLKTALPEALKPLTEEITNGRINRNVEPSPRQPVHIEDVSEEQILEAIEAGDKPKAAALMRKQRQADQQRRDAEIQRITSVGGAAFGSVAKIAAERLAHYNGKYKKLIDERVDAFRQANPGVMITPEHYKAAHDIVVGENITDILSEDREAVLRQAREKEEALIPGGGREQTEPIEKEPTALSEVLAGDWKREFRTKQRAVGGRSDEDELRKLNFRGGLKEFVAVRKQMDALDEETGGTFGLDQDWVDENGRTGPRANKEKGSWQNA